MEKKWMLLWFLVFACSLTRSQQKNIAERLGYAADAKLLVIHADDLGLTHSENNASIAALKLGPVNSASIMVPCPWFEEIAAYARKNKSADLGLHLTLNSEWKYYKWGPVSSLEKVPSLVNTDGYFYALVDSLVMYGAPKEVEFELRNQVKKAYRAGIDVTHLDAHMGAAVSTPEFTAAYMKVADEFKLPVLLDPRIYQIEHPLIKELLTPNTVVADAIYSASPADFKEGMGQYYTSVFRKLKPGLSCLLIHLAYDDDEMKGVTIDHPDWGAAWRQADYDFFSSPECVKILEEEKIILVSWRSLRDKITRAE